jgi:hypothetical protein
VRSIDLVRLRGKVVEKKKGEMKVGLNLSQQTDTLPETSRRNACSLVPRGYY